MLTIYGNKRSRAIRAHWLARELGIPHEIVEITPGGAREHDALAEINPNRKIPAIDDDGVHLWESMAINLYLAKKYGLGTLYPEDPVTEALTWQWCFWVMTEIETPALTILTGAPDAIPAGEAIARPLAVLDGALAEQDYILGDTFTIADLNIASILFWLRAARFDLARWPNVAAWLERCLARPASRSA